MKTLLYLLRSFILISPELWLILTIRASQQFDDNKYSRQRLTAKQERQVEDRKVGHCTRELHTVQSG